MAKTKVRRKRIYLNKEKTHYSVAHLFKTTKMMQEFYKKHHPKDSDGHNKVLGVSTHGHYLMKKHKRSRWIKSPQTGTLLLSLEHCGAGVISHEIMHAVLYAHNRSKKKKQHPIVINSMEEEEVILHNLTYAVRQFYNWFWKAKKTFK